MKLPSGFRQFVRKVSRFIGPIGASTVLRGCPCPAPATVPDQPYNQSLAVDADSTLDANVSSWQTWCTETCGNPFTQCHIQVNTSDGNSLPASIACINENGQDPILASTAPWVDACKKACGTEQDCLIGLDSADSTAPIIHCTSWWLNCAGGRSTDGILITAIPPSNNARGEFFARMATLEAEAVPAFQRLAHELAAFGAPRKLRRRASRSRRDEMRHARTMTSFARRHGAIPARVLDPVRPLPLRGLEEVALENALEGCIRETYGAWNALNQSAESADPEIRATMRRIAGDEMRHAQLAWEIHEWAMKRLDIEQRNRITRAMQSTWHELTTRHADARELGELAKRFC